MSQSPNEPRDTGSPNPFAPPTPADLTNAAAYQPPGPGAGPSMPGTPPATAFARFCMHCGTALPGNAPFCPACGAAQAAIPPPAPASTPLPSGSYAAPSTPIASIPPSPYPYGSYAPPSTPAQLSPAYPYASYAPPLMPGQPYPPPQAASLTVPPAPASAFHTTLAPRKATTTGMMVATLSGAVAVLAFFLPAYVASGSYGASGPQIASALGALSSACGQYSGLVQQSSSLQGACTYAGIGQMVLWLEVILAGVATAIAGWQWYNARQTSTAIASGPSTGVLVCGGASLLILLLQFFVLPAAVSSATGQSAIGQAVAAVFGFGFWLMVLGTGGTVFGAIQQLRS